MNTSLRVLLALDQNLSPNQEYVFGRQQMCFNNPTWDAYNKGLNTVQNVVFLT